MEVWVLKVIILVGLFIATYFFALLPMKLMSVVRATKTLARRRTIDRCVRLVAKFYRDIHKEC